MLNGDKAVLFCFASNMKHRFEVDKAASPLFREAKFHFDFDAQGQIFVHTMGAEGGPETTSPDQKLGDPASRRPFLPQWVGLFSNRSETAQSPDQHSPGEDCAAKAQMRMLDRDTHFDHHSHCDALPIFADTQRSV